VVIKGTPLYRWWKQGKYKALSNKDFEKLIIKIKNEIIPPYIRIQRLVRDVPLPSIEAGPTISNLRQIVADKAHCQCIRCREIKGDYTSTPCVKGVKVRGTRTLGGFSETSKARLLERNSLSRQITGDSGARSLSLSERKNETISLTERNDKITSPANTITLNRLNYPASNGQEIFLQFTDDQNRLYALLRLRIPSGDFSGKLYDLIPVLKNSALIREVHTYGKLTAVGKKDKNSPQHIGLGKQLLQEAEKIAREELTKLNIPKSKQKIAVISGVGVRDYYRHNGYRLQNTYLVKKLWKS